MRDGREFWCLFMDGDEARHGKHERTAEQRLTMAGEGERASAHRTKMQHVKKSGVGHSSDLGHGVNFGGFFGALPFAPFSSALFSAAGSPALADSSRRYR